MKMENDAPTLDGNATWINGSIGTDTRGGSGVQGYADGFNQGYEAGLARFEHLVILMFTALVLNVFASRALKMLDPESSPWKYRVANFVEGNSYTLAFAIASFIVVTVHVPYLAGVGG